MDPLTILLSSLAVTPAVIVVGITVNLVGQNLITHHRQVEDFGVPRPVRRPRRPRSQA